MNKYKKSKYIVATALILLLTGCFSPSEDTIKTIAYNYGNGTFEKSQIDILNSYEKEGKTVYMLDINGALCEIPVVEMKDDVVGTAFNCKGIPTSKEYLKKLQEELLEKEETFTPRRVIKQRSGSRERNLSDIGTLYPLDTFTVSLKTNTGRKYLKTNISLELSGEKLSLELDSKSPVVRDRIIRILSSKTEEEVSSKKGKKKLQVQIMDTLSAMISGGVINGVYFTKFEIQ